MKKKCALLFPLIIGLLAGCSNEPIKSENGSISNESGQSVSANGSSSGSKVLNEVKADDFVFLGTAIKRYTGSAAEVTIPEKNPDGEFVTEIADNAFKDCATLTKITVSSHVTSIGDSAFSGCTALSIALFNNGLKSIGSDAFYGCSSLESADLPNTLESIGYRSFYDVDSLRAIFVPGSVQEVGSNAFKGADLKAYLKTNKVGAKWHKEWNRAIADITYNVDRAGVENGIRYFVDANGDASVDGYFGNANSLQIPATLSKAAVKTIFQRAFKNCSTLTSINVPQGVTAIGSDAFYGCSSLTSINLPETLASIETGVFNYCTSLTSIVVPQGVTAVSATIFNGCTSLKSVTLHSGVTSIGQYAFNGCSSLPTIIIPASVTFIGANAFFNCSTLRIMCEAQSAPSTWVQDWNHSNCPVTWGYTSR